jgi:hypothetical protein
MSSLANIPSSAAEASSEDEFDWEEVQVPRLENAASEDDEERADKPHLEITFSTQSTKPNQAKKKSALVLALPLSGKLIPKKNCVSGRRVYRTRFV